MPKTEAKIPSPPPPASGKLAARLRKLREDAGWTRRQVAQVARATTHAVRRWEIGESAPNLVSLAALCEAWSMSADYLLGLTDDPTPRRKSRK